MALTADAVQSGEVDILQGDGTSGTIAITGTVTLARTFLQITLRTPGGSERPARQMFKARLSESNPGTSGYDQITWERNSSAFASTQTIRWSIVEFTSGVADVHQGEADPTATTTNVTIGATPSANSVPFVNFTSSKLVYFDHDMAPEPTISGSNLVLTFGTAPAAGEWDVDWQVVDFLEGVTVQTGSVTVTGTGTSGTASITAVTIADSIVLVHSCRTNTGGYSNAFSRGPYRGAITTTTQVTMSRHGTQGSSGGESVARYYVLEFTDAGILLETGSATITDTGTAISATLSTITDDARAVAMSVSAYGQRLGGDNAMQSGMLLFTQRVYNDAGTKKVEVERGKAGGTGETLECFYSIVQWPAAGAGGQTLTGTSATVSPSATAGSLSAVATLDGSPATVVPAAPVGQLFVSQQIDGNPASVVPTAPAGILTSSITITGGPAVVSPAAPSGALSAGDVLSGVAAVVVPAATTGVLAAGAVVLAGSPAVVPVAAPSGLLAAIATLDGSPALVPVLAPDGTLVAVATLAGSPAAIVVAAQAGALVGSQVLAGSPAQVLVVATSGALSTDATGRLVVIDGVLTLRLEAAGVLSTRITVTGVI